MDKRYAVTIQTTINSEALSDDRFRVRNNKMKRLIIDGSSPKKKIVSLMEEVKRYAWLIPSKQTWLRLRSGRRRL